MRFKFCFGIVPLVGALLAGCSGDAHAEDSESGRQSSADRLQLKDVRAFLYYAREAKMGTANVAFSEPLTGGTPAHLVHAILGEDAENAWGPSTAIILDVNVSGYIRARRQSTFRLKVLVRSRAGTLLKTEINSFSLAPPRSDIDHHIPFSVLGTGCAPLSIQVDLCSDTAPCQSVSRHVPFECPE